MLKGRIIVNINFQKLNEQIDPLSLLQLLGHSHEDAVLRGEELRAGCPIHQSDNQQSLCINIIKKKFHCKSCNAHGDLISLYAQSKHKTDQEAAQELAPYFLSDTGRNTIIPAKKFPSTTEDIRTRVADNKYTDGDVLRCWNNAKDSGEDTYFVHKKLSTPLNSKFGKNPRGYYATMTPLVNMNGDFKGFISLTQSGKYIYKMDGDETFFTPLGTLSDAVPFFIGEGIATVQTVWEAMSKEIPAISVGSWSNLMPIIAEIKKEYPLAIPVILADLYDNNASAAIHQIKEKFADTIILQPSFENLTYNTDKKPKDFNDIISKCDQVMDIVKEQVKNGISQALNHPAQPAQKTEIILPSSNIIEKIKQQMHLFKVNGKAILPGISTGYIKLDNIIGGFQEGHLITLAARTGHGKSWFALNFLKNIAIDQGISSLLISLEMSKDQIEYRLLSLLTGIPGKNMKDGSINEDELESLTEAYNTIQKSPLIIEEDIINSNLQVLLARIEKAQKDGVKFIVIDHVGLIHVSKGYSDNRVIEMGNISRKIKMSAKSLKIRILNCAQLNRDADTPEPPKGSQLRESDTLKQDSDILMLLHRPEKYNPKIRPGEIDIIIDKNREGEEVTITYKHKAWLIEEIGNHKEEVSESPQSTKEILSASEKNEKVVMKFSDINKRKNLK